MGGTHNTPEETKSIGGRTLLMVGMATLLALSVVLGVATYTSATVNELPPASAVTFGCTGVMQVSNVDCALGTHDAFAVTAQAAKTGHGMAPWCDGVVDMTRYGCFVPDAEASGPNLTSDR